MKISLTGQAGVVSSRSSDMILVDGSMERFWTKPRVTMSVSRSGSMMTERAESIWDCQSVGYECLADGVVSGCVAFNAGGGCVDFCGGCVCKNVCLVFNCAVFCSGAGTKPHAAPNAVAMIRIRRIVVLVAGVKWFAWICSSCMVM